MSNDRDEIGVWVAAAGSPDDRAGTTTPCWTAFDARTSNSDHNFALYVVDVESGGQVRIGADLKGAFQPVWGPDPTALAFMDQSGIDANASDVYVVTVDGSPARLLVRNADLWGWSPDGASLLIGSPSCFNLQGPGSIADQCRESLYAVSRDGTERHELVSADQLQRTATTPTSPGSNVAGAAWRPILP